MQPQPAHNCEDLKKLIREVPDFPKPGILFYDITTLLKDRRASLASSMPSPSTTSTRISTWCWASKRAASSSARRWPIA